MGPRWLSTSAALALAGCSSPWTLRLPEQLESDLFAVLVFDSANEIIGSTGLLPSAELTRAELPVDDQGHLVLLGYESATLSLQDDGAAPLAKAGPTEPLLPAPAYVGIDDDPDGELDPKPASFELDLTTPALSRCSASLGDLRVQPSCSAGPCAAQLTQNGCQISLEASSNCKLGDVDLRVSPNLEITHVTRQIGVTACAPQVRSPASLSVGCTWESEACYFDAFDPALAPEFRVEPKLADVLAGERILAAVATRDGWLIASDPATDLECELPSRLRLVDRDSFEVTRTTTAPPCVTALVTKGDSVFGVFGSTPQSVARFSATGEVVDSAPLVSPEDRSVPAERVSASAIEGEFLVLLLDTLHAIPPDESNGSYRLARVSLSNLAVEQLSHSIIGDASGLSVDEGSIVVSEDGRDSLVWYRLDDLFPGGSVSLRVGLTTGRVVSMVKDRALGLYIVSLLQQKVVVFVDETRIVSRASVYGSTLRPRKLGAFGAIPGTYLVSFDSADPDSDVIGLLDANLRQVLPGEVTVDRAIADIVPDPVSGGALLLPLSSVVYRASATDRE
ncbi:MAG: hypothetical protein HY791_14875 [Deltaproteobacteria bacterium]|nr:hypothetical protein [Deltaproteobacteria bacterium]